MRSANHASAGIARRPTLPVQRVEFTVSEACVAAKRPADDALGELVSPRYHPTAPGEAAS